MGNAQWPLDPPVSQNIGPMAATYESRPLDRQGGQDLESGGRQAPTEASQDLTKQLGSQGEGEPEA